MGEAGDRVGVGRGWGLVGRMEAGWNVAQVRLGFGRSAEEARGSRGAAGRCSACSASDWRCS